MKFCAECLSPCKDEFCSTRCATLRYAVALSTLEALHTLVQGLTEELRSRPPKRPQATTPDAPQAQPTIFATMGTLNGFDNLPD